MKLKYDQYIKQLMGVTGIHGIFLVTSFLTHILLSNYLPASQFGEYSFYSSLIQLFVVIGLFGQHNYLTRELLKVRTGFSKGFSGITRKSLGYSAIAWSLLAAVFLGANAIGWFNIEWPIVVLILLITGFIVVGTIRQAVQKAFDQVGVSQLPEKLLFSAVFLLTLSTGVFWLKLDLTILKVMFFSASAYFISQIAGVIIYASLKKKQPPKPIEKASETSNEKPATRWYFYFMSVIDIIDSNVDIYLIKYFEEYETVAIYSVVKRVAMLLHTIIYISNYALGPEVSKLYYSGQIQKLQSTVARIVRMNLSFGAIALIVLISFKNIILSLFGDFYHENITWALYSVMMLAQFVNVALGAPNQVLSSTGFERYNLWVYAGGVLLQVVLGSIALHYYNITGMAIVTLISAFYWNGLTHFIMERKVGVKILGFKR